MSNVLSMNELFDSKILENNFIIRFEFKDFKVRFEKRRKRAPFNLFKFDD